MDFSEWWRTTFGNGPWGPQQGSAGMPRPQWASKPYVPQAAPNQWQPPQYGWMANPNPWAQWVQSVTRQRNQQVTPTPAPGWTPHITYTDPADAARAGQYRTFLPAVNAGSQQPNWGRSDPDWAMWYARNNGPNYFGLPTPDQQAAMVAQAQAQAQAQAAQPGGVGGASLPNWDFSQWGQNWQNPLAGVPLEYWDYALGSQERALNWQAMQDNNRWRGEEIGLSKEQLALQRQQTQQAADQWMKEFAAQGNQWTAQHNLNREQFDWGKSTWGQEFNRANQNDAWARTSDVWNQAMQAATNAWQQAHAKEQLKVQDQGNALAAWGRRTNPLISAM